MITTQSLPISEMDATMLKEFISRIVRQLSQTKAIRSGVKNKIEAKLQINPRFQAADKELAEAKNKKKVIELEILSDTEGKELIERKDELSEKIKEFKGILSSSLEVYAKQTGEFAFKLDDGRSILMVRQFSFKDKQMRLFE